MSDLISRYALLGTIRKKMFDTRYDIELAVDAIKTAPAVDTVPVLRGYWIDCFDLGVEADPWRGRYACSECDCRINQNWYHYCPNCGAKMDGGK